LQNASSALINFSRGAVDPHDYGSDGNSRAKSLYHRRGGRADFVVNDFIDDSSDPVLNETRAIAAARKVVPARI
jgi:hypothetical protein